MYWKLLRPLVTKAAYNGSKPLLKDDVDPLDWTPKPTTNHYAIDVMGF